jgi:hypothetical protein
MTYTFGFSFTTPGDVISANIVANASSQHTFDAAIAASQTNFEIDVDIPVSPELKAFVLIADQNMTVKTNSTSAPDNTISLSANVPFFWITGQGSIPLAAAVTKFYVTNTTAGTLKCRALFNTVPNNT